MSSLGFLSGVTYHKPRNGFRRVCHVVAAVPSMADYVEEQVLSKFDAGDVGRVIKSWHAARDGEVLESFHEDGSVLQQAGSFIAGLDARNWHEVDEYQWAQGLEQDFEVIRDELEKCMKQKSLEKRGNNIWATAVREEAMAYGPDWRTLVLQDRGIWEPKNSKIFKNTVKILKKHKVPSSEVFFARQSPKTGIKPHTDNTNFTLTAHLSLRVPKDKSWIKVGNQQRFWEDGKMLIFDTSFMHETWNDGDTDRHVLLIRFWHPELSRKEIKALETVFRAIEDYEMKVAY